jgi:hypothetical protein
VPQASRSVVERVQWAGSLVMYPVTNNIGLAPSDIHFVEKVTKGVLTLTHDCIVVSSTGVVRKRGVIAN